VYLAAIEDEDWHVVGAPVYVRGFMRTYARFLGLDPEAAVARFSATLPAGTPAASAPARSVATERRATGDRSSPSLAAILSIVVAIAVVLFVGYEFYQYHAGGPAAVPVTESSGVPVAVADATPAPDASAGGNAAALPPPIAVASPSPRPAVKRGLSVRLTEASWLRVDVDGTVAYEGTLPAGSSKSFAGKSAVVRVGNAGGVQIAINGKAIGPLGASGDVVERHFVLTGE
jgi:cytoskeleton protein RodZ